MISGKDAIEYFADQCLDNVPGSNVYLTYLDLHSTYNKWQKAKPDMPKLNPINIKIHFTVLAGEPVTGRMRVKHWVGWRLKN